MTCARGQKRVLVLGFIPDVKALGFLGVTELN
jgi:hypothetical protein